MAILAELSDPRIRDVTVTHVEMSGDMRYAKVHVSVMGDESRQRLSLRGLQSAAGFLQSKVAKRIDTRYTPKIEFLLDQGVKRSIEVARILHEVLPHPVTEVEEEEEYDEDSSDESSALDAESPPEQSAESASPPAREDVESGDKPAGPAAESGPS